MPLSSPNHNLAKIPKETRKGKVRAGSQSAQSESIQQKKKLKKISLSQSQGKKSISKKKTEAGRALPSPMKPSSAQVRETLRASEIFSVDVPWPYSLDFRDPEDEPRWHCSLCDPNVPAEVELVFRGECFAETKWGFSTWSPRDETHDWAASRPRMGDGRPAWPNPTIEPPTVEGALINQGGDGRPEWPKPTREPRTSGGFLPLPLLTFRSSTFTPATDTWNKNLEWILGIVA